MCCNPKHQSNVGVSIRAEQQLLECQHAKHVTYCTQSAGKPEGIAAGVLMKYKFPTNQTFVVHKHVVRYETLCVEQNRAMMY